jgi:hypothetical protein
MQVLSDVISEIGGFSEDYKTSGVLRKGWIFWHVLTLHNREHESPSVRIDWFSFDPDTIEFQACLNWWEQFIEPRKCAEETE